MKLAGVKVVVVGMARSGVAAVELLREKGASVRAVDQHPVLAGVEPQTEASFADAELIVLSPGVPADLAVLAGARRRGVRVIGDLELASWFLEGDIIGITGANGADIDHIELAAAPSRSDADSRNFVLCSGGEYDRSPCGTGTSAVMAARHRRGQLAFGERWRQESVAGSLFTGWLTAGPGGTLIPHVRGTAFVTGEATLRFDPYDPFRGGLGRA